LLYQQYVNVGDIICKIVNINQLTLFKNLYKNGKTAFFISDQALFSRPNEDVIVTSMCIVEKCETDTNESNSGKSDSFKKDNLSKAKKQTIQPSVICGVSLRCPKDRNNSDDEQTDVQIMNQVNKSVSGELSPQIIPDSKLLQYVHSDSDILESSTSFIPYLLVVCVKEDVKKISKQPSMDSLKPSTSSNNIVPNLTSMSMEQPDWPLLDQMYDLDHDVHMVKVPARLSALSTSSPTEGMSKSEDESCQSGSGNNGAIKRLSSHKAGSILQCIEMPSNLRSEDLQVSSITPTLDKQHFIVVLSPGDLCTSETYTRSDSSLMDTDSSQVTQDSTEQSIEVLNSDTTSSEDNWKKLDKKTSDSENSEVNLNTNTTPAETLDSATCKQSYGCMLVYKYSYDCDSHLACIDETPVCIRYIDKSEQGVRSVFLLPAEISDQIEEEEGLQCVEDMYYPGPSLASSLPGDRNPGLYGQIAVIYCNGKLDILNTCDLSVLATVKLPKEEKFIDVTYCTGKHLLTVIPFLCI